MSMLMVMCVVLVMSMLRCVYARAWMLLMLTKCSKFYVYACEYIDVYAYLGVGVGVEVEVDFVVAMHVGNEAGVGIGVRVVMLTLRWFYVAADVDVL